MRLSNRIVLATLNRNKYEEFRTLFGAYPDIEVIPASGILRNPEKISTVEHFHSYIENAAAKARLVNNGSHYPTLADDSGLEVEGLDWKPGARSHRYADPQPELAQDRANNNKLLAELSGGKSRNARFVCSLALVIEGVMLEAKGILEGTITDAPRGTNGFGYDPLFVPKGAPLGASLDASRTFAEMTDSEKNSISHRAKALHDLMNQVRTLGIQLVKP
ncbi:non-canonical purine NTP pyrophosphatase [Bdellovibrionota bacterium FG-1]